MSHPQSNVPAQNGWNLEHTYAALPEVLFQRVAPEPVKRPEWIIFNRELAQSMGLDAEVLAQGEGAAIFAGNELPPRACPIAQAYAGHQFGNFTMLGDGRAVLLGEQITPDGRRLDVQLKGSGQTPYSRRGDGRAAVGPMLREYVISEAMHALGIPTTRSLAVVRTGQHVFREEALPGAVLTRVAASHVRVGTFEFAAAIREKHPEALRALAEYTIRRHDPDLLELENRHLAFLEAVMGRQADLMAQWMLVGFVHGVMNTDNMAVSGETIDYGPCAFMDHYDPATVFSSIDRQGRYAYGNQPGIAQWNLTRLAEALLPLLDPDEDKAVALAKGVLERYPARFQKKWHAGMRAKLGLFHEEPDDVALCNDLLKRMHEAKADYTNTFLGLSADRLPEEEPFNLPAFREWTERWQARRKRQVESLEESQSRMRTHNPAVIPRNELVEEALTSASDLGDLRVLERLLAALAHPYDHRLNRSEFQKPAPVGRPRYQTFCGT
jgi:uncharacterized protein YdiU (UPF0061 family)